ncbi:hypothetical protein R5R35_012278 [Gryllus longicercus]|uniref:Myosin tail domain-containing protein n=1 Tax=Gryllus longicercus TaxID=2509291 RepID=A0AAN9VMR0_9ORTH
MPTAAWSTKCTPPAKPLVQRQLSTGNKSNNVKPISPPRSKTASGKSKPASGDASSSPPAPKTPVKNGSVGHGPAAEKGHTVPRVVAAEMKTSVKKTLPDPTRSSSNCLLPPFPPDILHGANGSRKELTRCSSTEGALERRGYPARPGSRQSTVQPAARNGKSELKRCFSSEGILERKGMGQKNLSLSRKASGENLSALSDAAKTYGGKNNPAQRKTSLPSSCRVNKTVIKNTVTATASKETKSKLKYISSGLKSMIEIPGNVNDSENHAEVKSVIEITGNETKEDETPPEIPPFPSLESIGMPSKNLSTIIAVDFVTNHEDMTSSPPPAHASSTIQVVQDSAEQPLSSTIIAVNYDVSTEVNKPELPPQSNTQIFNGKSSVWSRLQTKSQPQPSPATNVAVNINIKQEVEEVDNQWTSYPPLPPPPVPPLPSALLEEHFESNETVGYLPPPPVLPPRKNRSNSLQEGAPARGSKIPLKIPASLTSLSGTDCLIVCSDEDGMKNGNIEESNETGKKKSDWEALFKKYEALEKECDSASTTESEGIEMQHSSLTTIDSSEEDKKSCTEMLVTPLESSEDEKSCKNLVLTNVNDSEKPGTLRSEVVVTPLEEYENQDFPGSPNSISNPDSADKFSRLSTASIDSIGEENVLSDMPLIQPVTSISIQQCETLYKAKVAKVLADETCANKVKETEREISEEIFDVSLMCKKHLEKVQKSTVQVVSSVSKNEVRETKKRDCSPVILKKCEQWSIEKEKVLISQRPLAASENVSRNPQFALTIAKFEQQQQHTSEKENKKVPYDVCTNGYEKLVHEKQELNKNKFPFNTTFESVKERYSKSYDEDVKYSDSCSTPSDLLGVSKTKDGTLISMKTEFEKNSQNFRTALKDENLSKGDVLPKFQKHVECSGKSNGVLGVLSKGLSETKQDKEMSKFDALERKYLGGKDKFTNSCEDLSKNVIEKKSISELCQNIQKNSGSPSSEPLPKFHLKPLPLIPSVPRTDATKYPVNVVTQEEKRPAIKQSSCVIKECLVKENFPSVAKMQDCVKEKPLDIMLKNSVHNDKEAEIKVLPKLREQYLNIVEKTNSMKPCIATAVSNENLNKIRGIDSKIPAENSESVSKFELQRSKFENKEKIISSPKEVKKVIDSSKVSTIINNFNLQNHTTEDKNKPQSKGTEIQYEKENVDYLSKDAFSSNKEIPSKKLTASVLKNESASLVDKISLQKENSTQNFSSTYQTSCCNVYDENIDGKLFPSLLHRARGDADQQLPTGLIHLYHAGGYWTGSLPKELCSNLCRDQHLIKRGLYAVQPEPEDSHYMLHNGLARGNSLDDETIAGGIGVVRANTGRQLSDSRYRTELEIFFRSGVLAQLEAQRDERLTDHVVQLQARCRGYLARRKLAKIKIQDMAVRCIQRNVRKFLLVREWPWWRLLVRVVPLLNVHRTEEQLRQKTEELEALRVKVEALEQERNHLKHDNDRLEAKLSEMTADLAEEHSTATLATERLEVETSERLRLEKELQDVQSQNKNLSQQGERLEMELLCLRAADMNGVLGSEEDEDGEGDTEVYKQRYERTMRELEFTRRRLQQQHEDDLEQLVALKKQLEKKLADAYEEVEEQRQVVAQWKRKVQKLNADHNDLHLLLEEQNSRNNLLEKKQRKFDSELQLLQDELRQEKQQHERASREKEIALAEKYSLEQNISGIRLELELKEDRVSSLTQELDELMFGGKTEEEVAHLKKNKHELEKKLKEQEEELDDLAGQVQLLEQSKLRLEMSLEQQRKEARRELSQRDEELEDVRCNAQKKVKALEAQLESEHEERTQLVRERHELERRLAVLEEQNRNARVTDEDTLHRLRRDLRRTKALLRDAQTMLERARGESPGKVVIRQLRNQLEDTEVARAAAVKARQAAELELAETQAQLEEVQRARQDAEERASAVARERSELQSQLEENEEELAEVLKKYRAAVQQLSVDQMALQEQAGRVAELESERASLKEQLAEMGSRLENMETLGDPSSSLAQKRLELRAKELESKLELEQTTRSRLEVQITRLKEAVEKLQDEIASLRTKEQAAQDAARRLQRQLREAREEQAAIVARESEGAHRRRELEKRLEAAEAEAAGARGDLRLALARIEDLQAAMQGELEEESSGSDPDRTESDHDSDGSDESINTFLANHKVRMNSSPRSNRPSLDLDVSPRSLEVPVKKSAEPGGKESFA